MSEHLFILYGTANTGKTTTFNKLFETTCDNFLANLIAEDLRLPGVPTNII